MLKKIYPDKTRELLLNLAYRLRMARRCFNRANRDHCDAVYLAILEGERLEVWNTFQAAKQIVFHE